MKKIIQTLLMLCLWMSGAAQLMAQETLQYYVVNPAGCHLGKNSSNRAVLISSTTSNPQKLTFIPCGDDYYTIQSSDGKGFLGLSGSWDTFFLSDSTTNYTKYSIEPVDEHYVKLRCKQNKKYLGVDNTTAGSYAYSDKDGSSTYHYWYLGDTPTNEIPLDTVRQVINPFDRRQTFEGWGVSLCWWANMCGKWSDDKIDQLIDWLVSPTGLNYNIFRYNIGGGDDPENNNCTLHHMGSGKGLRAEMEGFKDSSDDEYHWERDEAQRKIMLKIKEKRPDAIFEAFSNSAPWYMTYSGCCAGNTNGSKDNLKPEYYEEFAHYLVDVCKHYKDEYGIEFRTLEPFNEPLTSYWSANGGQEGCHFDVASQISFLKVIHPILQESGLSTVLSASDETSVGDALTAFKAYNNASVLPLIKQWNAHTYSGSDKQRIQMRVFTQAADLRLWMSETGDGGSGLSGNLAMAQRLMSDVRYMMPSAWVDWQYVEEGNDQWCLVRGNFSAGTFEKVKNYYVRQHFSKFIQPGHTFLSTLDANTIASRSCNGDSLIIVSINSGTSDYLNIIDLSHYASISGDIKMYMTSSTYNMASVRTFKLTDKILSYTVPSTAVVTLVLKVEEGTEAGSNELKSGATYAICTRAATNMVIDTQEDDVLLQAFINSPTQRWTLTAEDDNAFSFTNDAGESLSSGSYHLHATATATPYRPVPIDAPFYRIDNADGSKSFDLENEKFVAGTYLGLWEYGSSVDATHRQWLFVKLPSDEILDGIFSTETANNNVLQIRCQEGGITTIRLNDDAQDGTNAGTLLLYTSHGQLLYSCSLSAGQSQQFALATGCYIARFQNKSGVVANQLFIAK